MMTMAMMTIMMLMMVCSVGPRERDPVLIERSNLVNISKLVVKEVMMMMMMVIVMMLVMVTTKMIVTVRAKINLCLSSLKTWQHLEDEGCALDYLRDLS